MQAPFKEEGALAFLHLCLAGMIVLWRCPINSQSLQPLRHPVRLISLTHQAAF